MLNKSFKNMYNDPNHIKTILLEEYQRYIAGHVVNTKPHVSKEAMLEERDAFIMNTVTVLIAQGKKTRGDQVKSGDMSFASFIEYPDYYLTILDLWILFNYFKIPVIFLSKTCLIETGNRQLVGFSNEIDDLLNERFIFIMTTTPKKSKIPQYKIITHDDSITFSFNDFKDSTRKTEMIEAIAQKPNIIKFIEDFNPTDATNACKKRSA